MLPLRSVLPSLLSHFELRASHGFVENEVQRVGLYKSDDAVKFIGSPDSRRSVPCKDSIIFYPCQASLQDKKIRIDGARCRKERLAKTRTWIKANLFIATASSVSHAKQQSWESDHFPILAIYPAVACAQIENPKGCKRRLKLLKAKSWRSNGVLKNSNESIICSYIEAMRCSSAASLGKQFQRAVCQRVWEDLQVQNSISTPHLKSWKTSGLWKTGTVPSHIRSHKWYSWDHLCETLCIHKCVLQVAKGALLWTRIYKNNGRQRSTNSLPSGQFWDAMLFIGKKSLRRVVAKTWGRREGIHNETPARRSWASQALIAV